MRIHRGAPLDWVTLDWVSLGCLTLAWIGAGLNAQGAPTDPLARPQIFANAADGIDPDSGLPLDEMAGRAVALTDFLEVAPGSESGLCAGLIITPNSVSAKPARCGLGGTALLVEPGDYRITGREPLTASLAETYESVDLRLRVMGGRGDEGLAATEAMDYSRRKKPDTSFCVRVSEAPDGPPISGLAVRFFQRYRVAAEGLTDGGGRFCAEQLRREPLVAAVNGGEDYHDRAVRVEPGAGGRNGSRSGARSGDRNETQEIPLEPLHEFRCTVADPGAFLRRHADASFHLQPVPAPPDTALTPGTALAWSDRGDAVRDGVRFRAYDSQLTAREKSPAEDGPPPAGVTVWLTGEDYAVRFPRKADEKRSGCKLTLPPPETRRQRLDLRCPAGKYLPPGRAVFLDNRPAAVPIAAASAGPGDTPAGTPGGKPATAPAETALGGAVKAPEESSPPAAPLTPPVPPPGPPAAPLWEARRMARIPEEGILNTVRLPAEFVSSENPTVMPAWDARGCEQKAVPFKPDENGAMILPLGDCCIERDLAVRIEKYFRESRAAAAPRQGRKPRAESNAPEDLHGCLYMAPLTRQEREAAAGDSAMRGIGCRGVEEIFRLLNGGLSDELSE